MRIVQNRKEYIDLYIRKPPLPEVFGLNKVFIVLAFDKRREKEYNVRFVIVILKSRLISSEVFGIDLNFGLEGSMKEKKLSPFWLGMLVAILLILFGYCGYYKWHQNKVTARVIGMSLSGQNWFNDGQYELAKEISISVVFLASYENVDLPKEFNNLARLLRQKKEHDEDTKR